VVEEKARRKREGKMDLADCARGFRLTPGACRSAGLLCPVVWIKICSLFLIQKLVTYSSAGILANRMLCAAHRAESSTKRIEAFFRVASQQFAIGTRKVSITPCSRRCLPFKESSPSPHMCPFTSTQIPQ